MFFNALNENVKILYKCEVLSITMITMPNPVAWIFRCSCAEACASSHHFVCAYAQIVSQWKQKMLTTGKTFISSVFRCYVLLFYMAWNCVQYHQHHLHHWSTPNIHWMGQLIKWKKFYVFATNTGVLAWAQPMDFFFFESIMVPAFNLRPTEIHRFRTIWLIPLNGRRGNTQQNRAKEKDWYWRQWNIRLCVCERERKNSQKKRKHLDRNNCLRCFL